MVSAHVRVPKNVPLKTKSYTLTLNNPQDHYEWAKGFNPDTATEEEFQALMRAALQPFTSSGTRKRSEENNGAMVGCEKGETFHMHLYVFGGNRLKAEVLMSQYPGAHIEKTKGTAEECWEYLLKDPNGKHADKGETRLSAPFKWGKYFESDADTCKSKGASKDVYSQIDEFIAEGLTPEQIAAKGSKYAYRFETIAQCYQLKRKAETPASTEREVVYHFGATGSGKTYAAYDARLEEHPNICMLVAAQNCFDDYYQQEHVVIEELRGKHYREKMKQVYDGTPGCPSEVPIYGNPDIDLAVLLKLIDRNNIMLPSRYHNTYWCPKSVHITSKFAPEDLYEELREPEEVWELIRRFTKIVYHYIENGEYKEFALTPEEYVYEYETFERPTGKTVPVNMGMRIDFKFGHLVEQLKPNPPMTED